jgi:WhiB family redox-sensing transcriptional regulator
MGLDWMSRAACIGMDTDEFFPKGPARPKRALAVCAECPVQQQCGEFALAVEREVPGDDYHRICLGVWGGMRGSDRAAILSDRQMCGKCGENPIRYSGLCNRCNQHRRWQRKRALAETSDTGH